MKQVKICLGRFQPFTLGHLKMATYKDLKGPKAIQGFKNLINQEELLREQPNLKEIAKQKTVILSIYTPKDKVDAKHPFDSDLMKSELDIVKNQYSEIEDIMYVPSADICLWGEMIKKAGYQASVWLTGSDEAKAYVEMAMKVPEYEQHNRDNRDCDGAYTKSFYVESIDRIDDSQDDFTATISGTKVREAILNGDKEYFKKAMPKYTDILFDDFKEAIQNIPESKSKKKMKNIKEYLNEKLSDVEAEWHPKEGLFTEKDPQKIANYLIRNSKDKGQAMKRLIFYMNRAGENLENKTVLNKVKELLKSE